MRATSARRRVVEHPAHQLAVGPADRAIRAGQRGDLEPGVAGQQLDHALAHGACRAEDGDWDFAVWHWLLLVSIMLTMIVIEFILGRSIERHTVVAIMVRSDPC